MNTDQLKKLKQDHFKITPKRLAILDLFDKKDRCLTPEVIWEHLKKTFKQSGMPSVYRNLELFVKQGILVKVDRQDRKRYYALCHDHSGHHHHHSVNNVDTSHHQNEQQTEAERKLFGKSVIPDGNKILFGGQNILFGVSTFTVTNLNEDLNKKKDINKNNTEEKTK